MTGLVAEVLVLEYSLLLLRKIRCEFQFSTTPFLFPLLTETSFFNGTEDRR